MLPCSLQVSSHRVFPGAGLLKGQLRQEGGRGRGNGKGERLRWPYPGPLTPAYSSNSAFSLSHMLLFVGKRGVCSWDRSLKTTTLFFSMSKCKLVLSCKIRCCQEPLKEQCERELCSKQQEH